MSCPHRGWCGTGGPSVAGSDYWVLDPRVGVAFCSGDCLDLAALNREPFLPPCFELGSTWHSDDGGLTWERAPMRILKAGSRMMTVTAINYDRGEVTMSVSK